MQHIRLGSTPRALAAAVIAGPALAQDDVPQIQFINVNVFDETSDVLIAGGNAFGQQAAGAPLLQTVSKAIAN